MLRFLWFTMYIQFISPNRSSEINTQTYTRIIHLHIRLQIYKYIRTDTNNIYVHTNT